MARINSTHQSPLRLPLLTIGFCTDLAGEERLRAAGVERIWRSGDGNMDLEDALYDFRDRAGALAIAGTLRIFGDSRKEISRRSAALLRAGIEVVDIDHPEENLPELLDRALASLHASKAIPSHRTARRRGSLGGLAKAASAAAQRAAIMAEDAVRRLCKHPNLTWRDCADILGPPFSVSTLQRLYR